MGLTDSQTISPSEACKNVPNSAKNQSGIHRTAQSDSPNTWAGGPKLCCWKPPRPAQPPSQFSFRRREISCAQRAETCKLPPPLPPNPNDPLPLSPPRKPPRPRESPRNAIVVVEGRRCVATVFADSGGKINFYVLRSRCMRATEFHLTRDWRLNYSTLGTRLPCSPQVDIAQHSISHDLDPIFYYDPPEEGQPQPSRSLGCLERRQYESKWHGSGPWA